LARLSHLLLIALLLLALIAPLLVSCQAPADLGGELNAIVAPHRFSVLSWEACALLEIGCDDEASSDIASSLDDAAALDAYFALGKAQRGVERRLREASDDGAAETVAALSQELADIAAQRAALRERVEAVIAQEIRAILTDEGIYDPFPAFVPTPFPFPPVAFRLGRPPTLLIVSPRERIESIHEVMLVPSMVVETREEIETAVAELGYCGLVEDLGGLAALYPPLIDDDGSLPWTIEAATHEWLHQYLAFTPLGFRYVLDLTGLRPDYEIARMNETVASMLGREL